MIFAEPDHPQGDGEQQVGMTALLKIFVDLTSSVDNKRKFLLFNIYIQLQQLG